MRFSTPFTVLALATTALGLSGQATYYGGNLAGGSCSFSTYTLPAGIYGTALSDSNWDSSAHCGACISVTGPDGNSITAMIVDQCPGCGTNHLDLFPDAFAKLADPSKGIIGVTWSYVDCSITSPLEVHNKDGVSAYWFSMQVVNANKEVSKLEVSIDAGQTWQETERQSYNFFQKSSGFGTSEVTVKVTSIDGDVVVIESVPVSSDTVMKADVNFISEIGEGSDPAAAATTTTTTAAAENLAAPAPAPAPTAPAPTVETPVVPASTGTAEPSIATTSTPAAAEVKAPTPLPARPITTHTIPASAAPQVLQQHNPTATAAAVENIDGSASALAPSAPPAADLHASPSAVPYTPEGTSTTSSTLTIYSTITVHTPKVKTVSKVKPTVAPYPTTLQPAAPDYTIAVYDCSSSSIQGVASSTLQIIVSPTPESVSYPSTSASASTVPFTGAASTLATTSALMISAFTVVVALLI